MISLLRYKSILWALVLAQLISLDLSAQKIVLSNDREVLSISSDLFIFEDKDGEYTIMDVLDEKASLEFKKTNKKNPSFSFTASTIWCRFILVNETQKESFLEINPPILNEIVLYTVFDNNKIDSICRGSLYSNKKQEISANSYIFKLHPDAKSFYLKINTNTRLYINAKIGTDSAFLLNNSNTDLIKGSYGGILLMIFLYNLFLLFTSHDKVYFYYLLHLINSSISFLYLSGIGIEYIWSGYIWINKYIITVMSLGFIFPILFTINYLDTKIHSKKLHLGMIVSILALVIISIFDLSGQHMVSGKLLNTIGFLIIIFVIFSTVVIKNRGFKPAAPFLYAWMFYLVGIFIQVLQGMNVIPTIPFTSNAMLIGSMFEIMILSLAIGYKINYLRNKMQLSITGEKEAFKEKEYLISEQSEKLEVLTRKQSKEIHDKNLRLKQNNAEIIEKNGKIKKQNKKLLESNTLLENKSKIINEQHESLVFHKNNLEELIELRTFELEKTTRKAEEADRLKTSFLKNVSHEIRTPMNAIAGFASLLFDIDKEDKRHAYYVDIITKNTDDLLNLIDNIRELARIQTGSVKIKYVTFDPRKTFNALNDLFIEKMKEERKSFVSLKLSIPEDKDIKIKTDYNRFWQIVFHLIDNAVKYTEKGFVQFGYQINNSNDLEVIVKDTGKGIPKEKLDTVFDRFSKTEESKSKLYSGTGLGLSLVKGLVELMDGTVTIKTKTKEGSPSEASGTTFNVIFKNIITE
ncbi:MAG: hypothetical protein DRI95_05175 [Bacteroidetes bacterium]|nr:MAG: hypothetical protein DRI95_05175 [Bacteroidota bacterium]